MPKRSRERGPDDTVVPATTTTTTTAETTTSQTQQLNSVNNNTSNNNNNISNNNNNIQSENTRTRLPPAPAGGNADVVEADESNIDGKELAIYDIILQVSQAHRAHCGFTEESTRDVVQKPMIIPVRNIQFLM